MPTQSSPVAPVLPSAHPLYLTTCLRCGGPLQPVALPHPDTAPWLCPLCRLGFWACELTMAGRRLYRGRFHAFGHGAPASSLRAAVHEERKAAHVRGWSLREDELYLVPLSSLQAIEGKVRHAPFAALVSSALSARKVVG